MCSLTILFGSASVCAVFAAVVSVVDVDSGAPAFLLWVAAGVMGIESRGAYETRGEDAPGNRRLQYSLFRGDQTSIIRAWRVMKTLCAQREGGRRKGGKDG